jgi:hypothetical protein
VPFTRELNGVATTDAWNARPAGSGAVLVHAPNCPPANTPALHTLVRAAFVESAPPVTYTKFAAAVAPCTVANVAACPLTPAGIVLVFVH